MERTIICCNFKIYPIFSRKKGGDIMASELGEEKSRVEEEMKRSGEYKHFYNEYSNGYWDQENGVAQRARDNIERKKALETIKRLG